MMDLAIDCGSSDSDVKSAGVGVCGVLGYVSLLCFRSASFYRSLPHLYDSYASKHHLPSPYLSPYSHTSLICPFAVLIPISSSSLFHCQHSPLIHPSMLTQPQTDLHTTLGSPPVELRLHHCRARRQSPEPVRDAECAIRCTYSDLGSHFSCSCLFFSTFHPLCSLLFFPRPRARLPCPGWGFVYLGPSIYSPLFLPNLECRLTRFSPIVRRATHVPPTSPSILMRLGGIST